MTAEPHNVCRRKNDYVIHSGGGYCENRDVVTPD